MINRNATSLQECQANAFPIYNANFAIEVQILNGNCTTETSTITPTTTTITPTTTTPPPSTTTIKADCSPVLNAISEIINGISLSFDSELQVKIIGEEDLFFTDLSVQNLIASFASQPNSTCINLKNQLKSPIKTHEKFLQCITEVNKQKISKVGAVYGILSSNVASIASCQLPVS